MTVPAYLQNQGVTEAEYVEGEVGDIRGQGGLGAIGIIVIYIATVVRGGKDRIQAEKRARITRAEKAKAKAEAGA